MGYAAVLGLGTLGSTTLAEYDLSCRIWRHAGYGDYPFKLPFYESNIRPHMKSPGDLIVVTEAALLGERGGWAGVTGSLARRYHDASMEGQDAYASAKGEAMADGHWPGLVIVRSGALSMIDELKGMGATVCVSSGIEGDLLDHAMRRWGLNADCTIPEVAGEAMNGQPMGLYLECFEPGATVFYDDRRRRLEALQDCGFHVVASPEGHDHPADMAGLRKAGLEDFPGVFADTLGIAAGQGQAAYC